MADDHFGSLLRFLQVNNFRVVLIEGPRGSGKTTCCTKLLAATDLVYYKTWGSDQKWIRTTMSDRLNLDLPQGTYFVMDFIMQVRSSISRPILADRGNISAIAYQRELPYGKNKELHKYYVRLMRESDAAFLVLDTPSSVILKRRIARGSEDEQRLHTQPADYARRVVETDVALYEDSVDLMVDAGLRDVASWDIGDGTTCSCYVPEGTTVITPD